MRYDENNIYYLDELDDFIPNSFEGRFQKYNNKIRPLPTLPKLFPENIDVYCPGCSQYSPSYNPGSFYNYNNPYLYNSLLGTPYFNPANNKFNNFVAPPFKLLTPIVNAQPAFSTYIDEPQFLDNPLFTTPVVVRNLSDLLL